MNPELAGGLVLAAILALLCMAAAFLAGRADRRDDVIRARAAELPKAWEHVGPDDGHCHCGDCIRLSAQLSAASRAAADQRSTR